MARSLRALLVLIVLLHVQAAAATEGAGGSRCTVTRGPYLQLLTTDGVTVVWHTDRPSRCGVEFKQLGGAPRVVTGAHDDICVVRLRDLESGVRYAYMPLADGVPVEGVSTFRTDDPNLPFTFLVLGDSGTGGRGQRAVRDRMLMHPANFVLHAGDVVYDDGAAEDYDEKFFGPYREILRRAVLWPSLGNHDVKTKRGQPWRDAFYTPANNARRSENYYSFDVGNAHVLILDSNAPMKRGSPQGNFLEQDLARNDALWTFVVLHHPIYSSGKHGGARRLRERLAPVFDAHGVDLVFAGHDHNYERTLPLRGNRIVRQGEGTVYVTCGGGGRYLRPVRKRWFSAYAESALHFVRVDVAGDRLTAKMIRYDGAVRDSLILGEKSADSRQRAEATVKQQDERNDAPRSSVRLPGG
jgi:hypothetical protein